MGILDILTDVMRLLTFQYDAPARRNKPPEHSDKPKQKPGHDSPRDPR